MDLSAKFSYKNFISIFFRKFSLKSLELIFFNFVEFQKNSQGETSFVSKKKITKVYSHFRQGENSTKGIFTEKGSRLRKLKQHYNRSKRSNNIFSCQYIKLTQKLWRNILIQISIFWWILSITFFFQIIFIFSGL